MNKEKLAKVMDVVFDDCNECPFCDFCETSCSGMWERFFEAKLAKVRLLEFCKNQNVDINLISELEKL